MELGSRPGSKGASSLAVALLAVTLGALLPSCAGPRDDLSLAASPAPATPAERDARIRALEAAIEERREAVRALISAAPDDGEDPLHSSEALRQIAVELPKLQDELRGLLRAREIARAREKQARELHDASPKP